MYNLDNRGKWPAHIFTPLSEKITRVLTDLGFHSDQEDWGKSLYEFILLSSHCAELDQRRTLKEITLMAFGSDFPSMQQLLKDIYIMGPYGCTLCGGHLDIKWMPFDQYENAEMECTECENCGQILITE